MKVLTCLKDRQAEAGGSAERLRLCAVYVRPELLAGLAALPDGGAGTCVLSTRFSKHFPGIFRVFVPGWPVTP